MEEKSTFSTGGIGNVKMKSTHFHFRPALIRTSVVAKVMGPIKLIQQ